VSHTRDAQPGVHATLFTKLPTNIVLGRSEVGSCFSNRGVFLPCPNRP
jgi:hypothetical protein